GDRVEAARVAEVTVPAAAGPVEIDRAKAVHAEGLRRFIAAYLPDQRRFDV
ncbi:hypothetical protein PSYMO_35944, partial [Pseudomonas amygdali pv. mori str. 301020]